MLELEQQLALQARLLEPRDPAPDGPLAWPEEVPTEQTREGLEDAVAKAASECGLPLESMATDCAEPPCIAILRNVAEADDSAWSGLTGCASFQQAYPGGAHLQAETVDCGDGTEDRIVLVSGAWKELGSVGERWTERSDWLKEQWVCGP